MNTRVLLVPCLLFSTFAMADDLPSGSLPESGNSDVGYRTVAEALASLKQMKEASFSTVRGWTIVTDQVHMTVWSFAREDRSVVPNRCKASRDASRYRIDHYNESAL